MLCEWYQGGMMSEERFTNIGGVEEFVHLVFDNENIKTLSVKQTVKKLNEQQEVIEELHTSDEVGWGRAEKFEKELKQKKIYIKRLEYKVQKFKEMNSEQQATIQQLQREIEEWKKENRELLDQIQEFERIPKSIRELWVE